ncbi:peptidase C26 [Isosphaera pallida ATCC 43644]|uniref:gamma-glutamyl-gamma-aminobutyrate hydrolase n=2 Tax=Isosphaera pallida TaxID=128 RepID=E8R664_ISOPI|nr:peptidase C26 [Isosphaera pallida ATCC 43644]
MERRPRIGLVTSNQDPMGHGCPPTWGVGHNYSRAITQAGGLPWLIPACPSDPAALRAIFEDLDGLCLAGGHDIHPESYGQERSPLCRRHDRDRDRVELTLTRWAVAEGVPVLGICRGMQLLNVALGGTLYQDVAQEYSPWLDHDCFPGPDNAHQRSSLIHHVEMVRGSRIHDALERPVAPVPVNSMHHQGIRGLAPGLTATAHAPDGLIEAVEHTDHAFVVGVQWHPEELVMEHASMRALYRSFIAQARYRALARYGNAALRAS